MLNNEARAPDVAKGRVGRCRDGTPCQCLSLSGSSLHSASTDTRVHGETPGCPPSPLLQRARLLAFLASLQSATTVTIVWWKNTRLVTSRLQRATRVLPQALCHQPRTLNAHHLARRQSHGHLNETPHNNHTPFTAILLHIRARGHTPDYDTSTWSSKHQHQQFLLQPRPSIVPFLVSAKRPDTRDFVRRIPGIVDIFRYWTECALKYAAQADTTSDSVIHT